MWHCVKQKDFRDCSAKGHWRPAIAIRSGEDFLDERQTRMWIVDWEYAGMNDPLWDLGAL